MKRHFAFVNMPASGHINPTLPLVTELLSRGHRVSYAVCRDTLEPVRATGAEVIELATELPAMPPQRKLGPEQMGQMMQLMVGDIKASYPILREHFQADAPDAVCFDNMTPLGRMLADELPNVGYFDTWNTFAAPDGGYTAFYRDGDDVSEIRAPDGVHFNSDGYELLMEKVAPRVSHLG